MSLPPGFYGDSPAEKPGPDPDFHFPPLTDDYRPGLVRPPSVFAGCVMAWLGSVFGLLLGIFLIFIPSNSPVLSSLSADRAHVAGVLLVIWCPIVIGLTFLAFRGVRWAARGVVAMATVCLLAAALSLVTGSRAQGGRGLIWILASAGLIYASATSRRWFDDMTGERTAG